MYLNIELLFFFYFYFYFLIICFFLYRFFAARFKCIINKKKHNRSEREECMRMIKQGWRWESAVVTNIEIYCCCCFEKYL